jgi:hypothetical protein
MTVIAPLLVCEQVSSDVATQEHFGFGSQLAGMG